MNHDLCAFCWTGVLPQIHINTQDDMWIGLNENKNSRPPKFTLEHIAIHPFGLAMRIFSSTLHALASLARLILWSPIYCHTIISNFRMCYDLWMLLFCYQYCVRHLWTHQAVLIFGSLTSNFWFYFVCTFFLVLFCLYIVHRKIYVFFFLIDSGKPTHSR